MTQQKYQTQEPKPSRQAADLIGRLSSSMREAELSGGRSLSTQRTEAPYNVFTGNVFSGSNLVGGVAQAKERAWEEGSLVSMNAIKQLGLRIEKGGKSVVLSVPSPRLKNVDLPANEHYKNSKGELVTQKQVVAGVNFKPEPYFNVKEITNFEEKAASAIRKDQRITTVDAESLVRYMADASGITCSQTNEGKPNYQAASDEIEMPPVEDSGEWVCDMARALFEGVSAPLRENRWSVIKDPDGELMLHPEADSAIYDQYSEMVESQGMVAGTDFLEGMYRDQLLRRELFVTTIASLTGSDYVLSNDPDLTSDIIDAHYAPVPGAAYTGKILANAGFSGMAAKMVVDFAEGNDPGHNHKWFPPKGQWSEAARAFNDTGLDYHDAALQKAADKLDITPEKVIEIAPGLALVERKEKEHESSTPTLPMLDTAEGKKEVIQTEIQKLLVKMRIPFTGSDPLPPASQQQQANLRSVNPFN